MTLITGRYNMKADVYVQTTVRDPDTRQEIRTWALDRTVRCQARSIASEGIRTVGSTEQFTNEKFYDEEWVRLRTTQRITKRDRVKNIRFDKNNKGAYTEDNGDQTMFEVIGSQPVQDPFGRVIEWDVLMFKVQDE